MQGLGVGGIVGAGGLGRGGDCEAGAGALGCGVGAGGILYISKQVIFSHPRVTS